MSTYVVTRKSDGQEVYRYAADAAIAWDGFPFAEYDHTALTDAAAPVPTGPRRLSKLGFVGRLGDDYRTVLQAAKASVDVEMFVKMLDWATPDADGTSVDLDDPRVIGALAAMEAGGVIAAGRAAEIRGI